MTIQLLWNFFSRYDISVFLLKQLNGYREYTNRLSGNTLLAALRKAFSHYMPDVHRQKGREEHLSRALEDQEQQLTQKYVHCA